MPVNIPPPTYGSSYVTESNIIRVEFGDGYSQRAARGLNYMRRVWNLKWENLYTSEANQLESTLRQYGGYQSFSWQAPGDSTPRKWTCVKWTREAVAPGIWNMSAEFKEEFDI